MKEINLDTCKNYSDSLQMITKELETILKDSNISSIITNGNVGAVLQDSFYYELNTEKHQYKDLVNYSIGKIFNTELKINPLQLWTDNIIILTDEKDEIIEKLTIIDNNSNLI